MKRIDIPLYDMSVEFYVDKQTFCTRYNELHTKEDHVTLGELDANYGITGYNVDEGTQVVLIYINKEDNRGSVAGMLGTLAHEVFHTTMVVCRRIGHNPTVEDEPMAYLVGYIFREGAKFYLGECEHTLSKEEY